MIELKLTVTTEQLRAIADVLDGDYERTPTPAPGDKVVVEGTTTGHDGEYTVEKSPEQILQETTAEMAEKAGQREEVQTDDSAGAAFAASPEGCQGHPHQGAYQEQDDTPPPPPPADVQLAKSTSTGKMIPWDERIHAGSKKINADGTWRLKKGVDRDFAATVEAELAAAQGSPAPVTETQEQTPPPAVTEPAATTTAEPASQTPPPPPPAETAAPATLGTFPELLPLVTAAKAAGTLTDDRINEIIAEMGLTKFGELAVRTDKVAEFAAKAGLTNG